MWLCAEGECRSASPESSSLLPRWLLQSRSAYECARSQFDLFDALENNRHFRYTLRMSDCRPLCTVHLSTATSWRGGENQIFLLCQGLHARGQRAIIVAPAGAPLMERATAAGLETHPLKIRGDWDLIGAWKLARYLKKLRPDILHLHDGHAILPGRWAARTLSKEACSVLAHRRTSFTLKSRRKFGGRISQIIAISQAAKEKVLEAGIEGDRIAVIHSGLEFKKSLPRDSAEVHDFRARLGIQPQDLLVAHAAALTGEKRQRDLISAINSCNTNTLKGYSENNQKPGTVPRVHLVIAGSGPLEADLKSLAATLKAEPVIHFLGFCKDLSTLWSAADVVAFVSEAEGLCTALVEAQGAGLPALVTRAGGMVEVVDEGVTGRIVPIGGIEEMAAVLTEFARQSDLRIAMGRAAQDRAQKLFSVLR